MSSAGLFSASASSDSMAAYNSLGFHNNLKKGALQIDDIMDNALNISSVNQRSK
jgi:hypothetical protein